MRIFNPVTLPAMRLGAVAATILVAANAWAFDGNTLDEDFSPQDALRLGAKSYLAGDMQKALSALEFAAQKGNPVAQWKLAKMYASGEGVPKDHQRAFELYLDIANNYADEDPRFRHARVVSSAFVSVGHYLITGIDGSEVTPSPKLARRLYNHASKQFADPDAQFHLAKMMAFGIGGSEEPYQAARWAKMSARKGHVGGQALYGHLMFAQDGSDRNRIRGLMWLTIAENRAPQDAWIADLADGARAEVSDEELAAATAAADRWLANQ